MEPALPEIVREELEALDEVSARLERVGPREVAREDDLLAELERIQAEIHTAKTEDRPALEQQYDRGLRLLEQLRRGRDTGRPDPGSPYFAHLRIRTPSATSDIFLGRTACLEEGLRIVDWRNAPIARIYYRYREGDDYVEDFAEREVEGRVLARRSVAIHDGRLARVEAPQGRWLRAEDAWLPMEQIGAKLHATGKLSTGLHLRADKRLPDIAALIDPAQFELIARPGSGPVVIRGGAGSGKTTVALHRIAWLAYQNPARFAPHRMLVVVWGRALRDYTGKVLPGLGVKGVPVVTWSEWSRKLVERHFPHLPDHDGANTPAAVAGVKLHPGLPGLLEELIRGRKAPPNGTSALEDWKLLCGDRVRLRRLAGVTEAEVEATAQWAKRQQEQFAAWDDGERDAARWLDEEDDAILLRAWQLRVGPFRQKGGGHLRLTHAAIDEVQDFSAMELAVILGCCDQDQCITLAGDTQQHIQAKGGSEQWEGLVGALGVATTEVSTLSVSYRSTAPVAKFSRAVLGSLAEDDAAPRTTRDGPPVEILEFEEHGACVDFLGRALLDLLAEEPLAAVALITRDMSTAELYFRGLEGMDVPNLRLVRDQTFAFAPGVDVVDVSQVKGLEFDHVILVDVSAQAWPDRPQVRRLLHVAASRAVHQLWVTCVGSRSPLLPARP
jgi:DNA helicase-2/ATP-dependent DNA helicase PcrA